MELFNGDHFLSMKSMINDILAREFFANIETAAPLGFGEGAMQAAGGNM